MTVGYSVQADDPHRGRAPSPPPVEGGMFGLLRLLAQNRGMLLKYPVVVCLLVVAGSFLFPNIYRSTVTILPPERDFQSVSQTTGDLKTFLSGGMALPMLATPSDILAAVLESRTVRESTLTALKLPQRWNMTPVEALSKVQDAARATVAPSGIISFSVEFKDRLFADTLANTMVQIADRLNQSIVNSKASRTRQFVEERLRETHQQLDSAAAALERFQQQHRTIALDFEVKAMIEGAATLRAHQTADEIELSTLSESLSSDHPRIRALTMRIEQTNQRLIGIESGVPSDSARAYLSTSMAELPQLAQELAVRLRDVKVAEALYELLAQQYEHARIQERRDTPTFSVLDPAAGGGDKVRPKRLYLGVATLFVGLVLAGGLIIARDWLARLAVVDPEQHRTVLALWRSIFRRSARSKEMSH